MTAHDHTDLHIALETQLLRIRERLRQPVQTFAERMAAEAAAAKVSGVTHGTYRTYKHHGCRCPDCNAANTAKKRQERGLWRAGVRRYFQSHLKLEDA